MEINAMILPSHSNLPDEQAVLPYSSRSAGLTDLQYHQTLTIPADETRV